MKKFQQILKQKAHLNKIKNAKKTISASSNRNSITKNNNNSVSNYNTGSNNNTKITQQAQLLLTLYENKNYSSIPAYKLLRTANLQQYTKGFIIRGYGINLGSLALLADDQKKKLYQDLKVLPGHTVKLDNIIKAIVKQSYGQVFQMSQGQKQENAEENLSSMGSVSKVSLKKDKDKDRTIYSNMNIYTNIQNAKKKSSEQEAQYQKQLFKVLNQYTPNINDQKANRTTNIVNSNSINQKKSSMLYTGQQQTRYVNKQPLKYLPPKVTQTTDFKKKTILDPSTKTTIRKSSSILTPKQGSLSKGKPFKQRQSKKQEQSSEQALSRLLKGVAIGSVVEAKKVLQIDLQLGKIKDLYKSFDSAVMSSTIANLDIEQLVYAFAGYVSNIVIIASEPIKKSTKNPSLQYNLKFNRQQYQIQQIQPSSNQNQIIQDQIGSILRQSYMHPLYRQHNIMQDIQCGDQVNSQGQNQQDQQTKGIQTSNDNSNEFAQNSAQRNMMESSFLGTKSFQFGLEDPMKIFEEPQPTQIDYFKPTIDSIFNFIKNIVLSAKMQRQIPVMAASYLNNFLEKSEIPLTSINYKRLLVTCLLLASKIWDDESFQTPSFSKTFPQYSTILLNEMEKVLLKLLQYKLKIDKIQYALMYFKLRKFIKKNIKSYQNRKLNIKKIRQLQNGVKNQYKCNYLTVKRNSF